MIKKDYCGDPIKKQENIFTNKNIDFVGERGRLKGLVLLVVLAFGVCSYVAYCVGKVKGVDYSIPVGIRLVSDLDRNGYEDQYLKFLQFRVFGREKIVEKAYCTFEGNGPKDVEIKPCPKYDPK